MKIENIKFRGKSKRTGEWLYGDLEYNRKKDIVRIHSYDDGENISRSKKLTRRPSDNLFQK